MSNRQVQEAKLKGFDGPHFPDRKVRGRALGLHRIQKRLGYHPERINQMLLDRVAKHLSAAQVQMYPETEDGYRWIGFIQFAHEGKRFGVLFPMLHDFGKEDGTFADRSVALYALSATDEATRLKAMQVFATVFVKEYRTMYRTSIRHSKEIKGISNDA